MKHDATKIPPSGMAISTSAIASEDLTLQTHLKASLEALWSRVGGGQGGEHDFRLLDLADGEQ